jgi:hypothetical protein
MMSDSIEAKARAEASFKRKEEQAQEGAKAWAEYEAQRRAVAEKTERLRALRLAREAADKEAAQQAATKKVGGKQQMVNTPP